MRCARWWAPTARSSQNMPFRRTCASPRGATRSQRGDLRGEGGRRSTASESSRRPIIDFDHVPSTIPVRLHEPAWCRDRGPARVRAILASQPADAVRRGWYARFVAYQTHCPGLLDDRVTIPGRKADGRGARSTLTAPRTPLRGAPRFRQDVQSGCHTNTTASAPGQGPAPWRHMASGAAWLAAAQRRVARHRTRTVLCAHTGVHSRIEACEIYPQGGRGCEGTARCCGSMARVSSGQVGRRQSRREGAMHKGGPEAGRLRYRAVTGGRAKGSAYFFIASPGRAWSGPGSLRWQCQHRAPGAAARGGGARGRQGRNRGSVPACSMQASGATSRTVACGELGSGRARCGVPAVWSRVWTHPLGRPLRAAIAEQVRRAVLGRRAHQPWPAAGHGGR